MIPLKTTLLHLLGWALRPFLRVGIGRLAGVYPIWSLFARYFIGDTATVKIEGLTLSVPARDGFGFRLLTQDNWEPFLMYLFKKSTCPGMTVVDVGAHIGLYALVASTLVGPEGKVYAFEPELQNYDLLQKNIKANGFTNVVPLRKAVSDQPGTVTLYPNPKHSTLHSVGRPSKRAKGITCEAISLDDFLVGQKVDVVKIDVEGAEMAVLQGMQRIISENPEIKLLCEFVPRLLSDAGGEPRDFLGKLVGCGFSIYKLDDGRKVLVPVADVSRLLAEKGCYLFCVRGKNAFLSSSEEDNSGCIC